MNVQWYPGHMTKAKRQMTEDMKVIDLVMELVDARCPQSSRNPDIDTLAKGKSRIILLNKADLADATYNKKWKEYFENKGMAVLELNSKAGKGVRDVAPLVREVCREKIERDKKKGIINRPIRAMVVGIPNVGKSTFINSIAGRSSAKTGNKPGVTKGKQWIRISKELELLDTPGILWPKFEDEEVGKRLAYIGSINDEILQIEDLSYEFVGKLRVSYPEAIPTRYGIESDEDNLVILNRIAEARKCYKKGNEIDYFKLAGLIFDDFRSGAMGKLTLEFPD
ncbi:MAG: ribosome biogenesis GTPase YlqF [Lachnospiraceae bacterium]|nr:ribosome biogenesis GTPase YlqF [Candidatus Merdinaster equi]